MTEMNLEIGQKWQRPSDGATREILAVSELAVAYRFEDGMNAVSLHALTPERFAQRIEGWELIHPKPVPEGWGWSAHRDALGLAGGAILVRRLVGGDVSIWACGTRPISPDNLKAAIDYVMETGEA